MVRHRRPSGESLGFTAEGAWSGNMLMLRMLGYITAGAIPRMKILAEHPAD
ncbi:MAG: hypothetical protein AVDCRST_MAG93-9197 [uncultured Chloroflexia bacterium]|uniref:Uncharacterized protein n=1 Tax=uncultured Chloroflexia bacterium TaxID=1672391 RepID=A0A6J4N944_9CHLR|nr:MAG: hypothetical protein AVDCRST_MAG93-9197 [uncultured Chloroflexia bacterium]